MPRMLVQKCVETFACNWRQYIHQDSPVMSFAVIWHCRLCKSLYCCLFNVFPCHEYLDVEKPHDAYLTVIDRLSHKSPSLFFSHNKFNLTWLSFQPAEARNRNGTESCLWLYANLDVGEQCHSPFVIVVYSRNSIFLSTIVWMLGTITYMMLIQHNVLSHPISSDHNLGGIYAHRILRSWNCCFFFTPYIIRTRSYEMMKNKNCDRPPQKMKGERLIECLGVWVFFTIYYTHPIVWNEK